MGVGATERLDISRPNLANRHQLGSSPLGDLPTLSLAEKVGGQPSVSSIAVGKGMDRNQPVMEPRSDLGGRIGPML